MTVNKEDLRIKAKNIEALLTKYGFNVKIEPYFAYGKYAYYGNFYLDKECTNNREMRQISMYLGSKKECYDRLDSIVTEAFTHDNFYKFEDK